MEIWKNIEGCSNYIVSNDGMVKSIKGRWKTGSILNATPCTKGYPMVRIKDDMGKRIMKRVHILVMKTFVGEKPIGYECNHKDGNKKNNRVENLEWVPFIENMKHCILNGLHNAAKLNEEKVMEIRRLYSSGFFSLKEIGHMYGVTGSNIWSIIKMKSWKWV